MKAFGLKFGIQDLQKLASDVLCIGSKLDGMQATSFIVKNEPVYLSKRLLDRGGHQSMSFGGTLIRTVKSTSKTLGSFILFKDATNPGIFFGSVDAIIYDTDKTTLEIHLKNVSNQIADEFAIEMLYSKKIVILHDQIIELACGWTIGSITYASRSYGLRYLYG